VGFFALWKNKPSEYHAGPEEERETGAQIEAAFSHARDRGVRMFGRYGCRWSSAYQYFTFWLCPDLAALEAAMDELELAGDFKFADSEHIIGSRLSSAGFSNAAPGGAGRTAAADMSLFAQWRYTDAYHRRGPNGGARERGGLHKALFDVQLCGVDNLGIYDCRWSTAWDYFTVWQAPSFVALEGAVQELESRGLFQDVEWRMIVGNLEPRFRFGTHLQPA
jgi:hypothetical protein